MIRDENIHPVDVVLDPGAAPILNGVHDAVDHDLRAEGVIAGHGHHAALCRLAAGRDAVGIYTAALGAGAVMRDRDFDLV